MTTSSESPYLQPLSVSAVIVHHRSYDSLQRTLQDLSDQSFKCREILVVDNSEQEERREELKSGLPPNVNIIFTPNRGYGAAVNAGVAWLGNDQSGSPDLLLVLTHETRLRKDSLGHLVAAMSSDSRIAVSGPTLLTGHREDVIWSTGGRLSTVLGMPKHHQAVLADASSMQETVTVDRTWLDGACLLYRFRAIEECPIDEEFFLYMEEVDHHVQLRKKGARVVWVPNAEAWQTTGGMPLYYLARNSRLFFNKRGQWIRAIVVPPAVGITRGLKQGAKTRSIEPLRNVVAGLTVYTSARLRIQKTSLPGTSTIHILNPLGAALRHFEKELEDVLPVDETELLLDSFLEPSQSGESRCRWLYQHIRAIVSTRRAKAAILLWPVTGYWDIVLAQLLGNRRTFLIFHDPVPLVRSIGHGAAAKWLANFCTKVSILYMSERAGVELRRVVPRLRAQYLPHPILEPKLPSAPRAGEQRVIRVLGQYKKDRDLDALKRIAAGAGDVDLQILGRGWPSVPGWKVTARFLTEAELDDAIASSTVVIVPYKNFFQSGIAIRCMEHSVPVVGPASSSLAELYEGDGGLLVRGGDEMEWSEAVRRALSADTSDTYESGRQWRARARRDWAAWVSSVE